MLGKGSGRHLHALAHNRDPRRVRTGQRRRSMESQRALGLRVQVAGGARRNPGRDRRPPRAPAARGPPGLPHGRAAPALRRLLAGHALAHDQRGDRPHPDDPGDRGDLLAAATPLIEQQGCSLLGISLTNLENDDAVQLALPLDRQRALDATLDDVRDRFGSEAITRQFCSAATPAGPRRCCPTRAPRGRAPGSRPPARAMPDRLQADVIRAGLEVRVHASAIASAEPCAITSISRSLPPSASRSLKPSRSRLPA